MALECMKAGCYMATLRDPQAARLCGWQVPSRIISQNKHDLNNLTLCPGCKINVQSIGFSL